MWSDILLILVSAFGAIYVTFSLEDRHRGGRNILMLSLVSIVLYQINQFLEYEFNSIINELLVLIIFTSGLSFLLLTVRKLKPEYARYPYLIVLFPFILVVLYPLIMGETSIIHLILQLVQVAALLAFLSILISHVEIQKIRLLTALTFLLFLSAGILFWFGEMITIEKWLWQSLLAIGIGIGSYSICQFYKYNKTILKYEKQKLA